MATMADIEREIADRHLLTHPFYKAWTGGTLPRDALLEYARQYYAFEVRLPRLLTALHARCDDRATRTALLSNAWDEEHGESNHAELWLRFTDSLGLSRDEVTSAAPNASTSELVAAYRAACEAAPVEQGVAALYAYEAQLPAVSESKIDGLVRHFGFEGDARGLSFFQVHRTVDVAHAASERQVVESAVADGRGASALEGTRRALTAWWGFLGAFVPAQAAA